MKHKNTGGAYIAAAFFPSYSSARRYVYIDPSYFTTSYDKTGVLRHELGHALGYRHEHIRDILGCTREGSQWAFDRTYGAIGEKKWLELVPYVGATVGNIVSDGYVGARLKIGFNVTRDWAETGLAPRIGGPMLGGVSDTGPFEIYLVVDGQGRALAYNAFIDSAPNNALDRKYLVADGGYGLGIRFRRFSFTYRIAFVTPEYDQALTHDYKALRFTIPLGRRR